MDKNTKDLKWQSIAESIKWISTSLAIMFALYLTKESKCLWAFLIPALLDNI